MHNNTRYKTRAYTKKAQKILENGRVETTRDDRIRIVVLHEVAKFTFKTIVEKLELDIDVFTCGRIYKRTKETGTPSNRKSSGRPTFLHEPEQLKELEDFITTDKRTRRLLWENIRDELGLKCAVRNVQKTAKKLGFHKPKPRRKPGLRESSKPKRLA